MRVSLLAAALSAALGAGLAAQANRAAPVNQAGPIQNFKDTATLSVDAVTLDFMPAKVPFSDPRKNGKQFVRVAVTATNTGKTVFSLYHTSLALQTSDFTRHSITSSINKGNSDDRLETTKLEPGASVSGALYYEVGARESRETMHLVYDGHLGSDDKDFLFPLTPGNAAPSAPAPPKAAPAPPTPAAQPGKDLAAAVGGSLAGVWMMDEAKTRAAADGNSALLMKRVTLNADGTFLAGAGVTGKYKFDGKIFSVFYSGSPGLEKKGAIDGGWLKFPAPAGLGKFVYMKPAER